MRCCDLIPRPFFLFSVFTFCDLGRARGFERIIGVCAGVHGFLIHIYVSLFFFPCPTLPVDKYHETNPAAR